ncbi:hypothetical protein CAPTEDRAFT_189854 [Capitella teleta]|nr:hypothetical protein CAPTEDRAFT_189854 [Capitella teleta]|eukprot:ELU16169.1 hypothetical protein CAPTEDRAFT_189854 [Capitella teleta]
MATVRDQSLERQKNYNFFAWIYDSTHFDYWERKAAAEEGEIVENLEEGEVHDGEGQEEKEPEDTEVQDEKGGEGQEEEGDEEFEEGDDDEGPGIEEIVRTVYLHEKRKREDADEEEYEECGKQHFHPPLKMWTTLHLVKKLKTDYYE